MKKFICGLTAVAMVASGAVNCLAQEQWLEYDAGSAVLRYDSYNGGIERVGKYTSTTDTAAPKNISLIQVQVPESVEGFDVTSVNERGFANYDALKSISLPSSIGALGDYAFFGCDNLKSFTMPSKVTVVPRYAFSSCDLLSSVKLGNVTKIENNAFSYCKALTSISIPSTVTEIGASAFESSGLTSITIPSTVKSIGDAAFKGCSSIRKVTIPKSVQNISMNAFANCSGLEEVVIEAGVKSIGKNAFANCKNLKSISVPSTILTMEDTALLDSPNAKIICKEGTVGYEYAYKNGYATGTTSMVIKSEVPDYITVIIDGEELEITNQAPVKDAKTGRVLVPMRAIFEALDAYVTWDQSTKTARGKKGTITVSCTVNDQKITINGKTEISDVAPQNINGSVMVPVRVISEAFGAQVNWDMQTQTVMITSK